MSGARLTAWAFYWLGVGIKSFFYGAGIGAITLVLSYGQGVWHFAMTTALSIATLVFGVLLHFMGKHYLKDDE